MYKLRPSAVDPRAAHGLQQRGNTHLAQQLNPPWGGHPVGNHNQTAAGVCIGRGSDSTPRRPSLEASTVRRPSAMGIWRTDSVLWARWELDPP